ncbi:MAG TPA: hypothetical protein VL551_10560 [Actinospica sp.]|jgi:hypothetical protein|nr:hypothetical protein [Actinospica sp.]
MSQVAQGVGLVAVALALPGIGGVLYAVNMRQLALWDSIGRLGYFAGVIGQIAAGEVLAEAAVGFLGEYGLDVEELRALGLLILPALSAECSYAGGRIPLRAAEDATWRVVREVGGGQAVDLLRRMPACGRRGRRLRRRTAVRAA